MTTFRVQFANNLLSLYLIIMDRVSVGLPSHIPKLPILWVIGGPGSGKGTLCGLLTTNHNFFHLSAGELLRKEVKSGSSLGLEIENIMKKGELVNVEVMLHLIEKAMAENTRHNGYLIDGFPREVEQGILFEKHIRPVDCILHLKASEKTLKKRLLARSKSSNRVDDNEETINKRIKVYNKLQSEILEFYEEKIREISAEPSINEVYQEAVNVLSDFLAPNDETDSCD